MPTMIPSAIPSDTPSHAEAAMYRELRHALGGAYTVFHSFGIIERRRGRGHIDREIDFLILSRRGLIALEVKGGAIGHDGAENRWLQNGRPLARSPFEQAKENKYAVRDFLKGRGIPTGRMAFGHAVAFPDIHADLDPLPAEADAEILILGYELPALAEKIDAIHRFYEADRHRALSDADLRAVMGALSPEFEYGATLVDRIRGAESRIFRLTQEQCRILDVLGRQKRVLIEGCAGSGKTVLAVRKARDLAAEGKSVLLLCYNRLLGAALRDSVGAPPAPGTPGRIIAANYHEFLMTTLGEAGRRPEVPRGAVQAFWDETLPDLFDRFLQEHPVEFDAILVDEGQDFRVGYWLNIERMLREEGLLYIFYDAEQNLFGTSTQFPIDAPPLVLSTNCRNTRAIAEALGRVAGPGTMRPHERAPEGEPVVEVRCGSDREMRKALGRALHELIATGGLGRGQVVVLGAHNLSHTPLADDPKVGNFTIVERPDPATAGADVIAYGTIRGFKGLESDAVILYDVHEDDPAWNPNALYTAMSRAKHVLRVLYRR